MCECCGRKVITGSWYLLDGNLEAELCRPCAKLLRGEMKVEPIAV